MHPKKHFARSPSGSPSAKKCSEQSAFGDTYQFSHHHYIIVFLLLQVFSFTKIKKTKKHSETAVNYFVQLAQPESDFVFIFLFFSKNYGYLFIFRNHFCIRGNAGVGCGNWQVVVLRCVMAMSKWTIPFTLVGANCVRPRAFKERPYGVCATPFCHIKHADKSKFER